MNRIERVDAVLHGDPIDRPPFSFWFHFGNQFGPGAKYAETVIDFFEYFEPDILKVMNDYHLPMPNSSKSIKTGEDLDRIVFVDPEQCDFVEQLRAIAAICRRLNGAAYVIDTVFDPWQQLTKHLVGEFMPYVVRHFPNELKRALHTMTEIVIAYCESMLAGGSDGVFLAVQASAELVGGKTIFEEFIMPPVLEVLDAIYGKGKVNTLHLCGENIYVDCIPRLRVPILSWADRLPDNPTIAEMKKKFNGVAMCGIDHTALNRRTWESIETNVLTGLKNGGAERFILAPGCSVPAEMDTNLLKRMSDLISRSSHCPGSVSSSG